MIAATQRDRCRAEPCALVVAPWFLYDRLVQALDDDRGAPSLALTLFGKAAARAHGDRARAAITRALDASQRAAVQLCATATLAFVWGPPGTGKTVTLVARDRGAARARRADPARLDDERRDRSGPREARDAAVVRAAATVRAARAQRRRDVRRRARRHRRSAARRAARDQLARLRTRIGEVEQQLRFARALVEPSSRRRSRRSSRCSRSRRRGCARPRCRACSRPPTRSPARERARSAARDRAAHRAARARARRSRRRGSRRTPPRIATSRRAWSREARVVLCTLTNSVSVAARSPASASTC